MRRCCTASRWRRWGLSRRRSDPGLGGNLYGTTLIGGAANKGVVYKLDTTGYETVLYSFAGGADGGAPFAAVILDSAGNLYGTTGYGGSANAGVVYRLDTAGHETVLHSFTGGADGRLALRRCHPRLSGQPIRDYFRRRRTL